MAFYECPINLTLPGKIFNKQNWFTENQFTYDNILFPFQTMQATKRNAGLTSAVPRATLNDEELVSMHYLNKYIK